MQDSNQSSIILNSDDDSDVTQINFDSIDLDSFTIQECYCTYDEWNQMAND